jgi:hypothetical protein
VPSTSGRSETYDCRASMYPYEVLRGPTYHENSHASHTWHPRSHQTACFQGPEARSPWVRFPSPAPLFVVWRVATLPYDAPKFIVQFPQSRCVKGCPISARQR